MGCLLVNEIPQNICLDNYGYYFIPKKFHIHLVILSTSTCGHWMWMCLGVIAAVGQLRK